MVEKISGVDRSVQNKDVGILGLAFKPNTNSVAGSASVRLAQNLVGQGRARPGLRSGSYSRSAAATERHGEYCESAYAAAEGVDALVVGTGWPEFRALDFDRIKHLLKRQSSSTPRTCSTPPVCAPWDSSTWA